MTNPQLLLSIGIPTFAIILATVVQMNSTNTRFAAIEQRLIVMEGNLRRFYESLSRHEGKIESIESRLK